MTPEERERYDRIDRVLEFLANRQAHQSTDLDKTSAELDKLKEITGMHTAQIEANGKQLHEVGDYVLRLARIVEEQVAAQARLIERYFSNGRQ